MLFLRDLRGVPRREGAVESASLSAPVVVASLPRRERLLLDLRRLLRLLRRLLPPMLLPSSLPSSSSRWRFKSRDMRSSSPRDLARMRKVDTDVGTERAAGPE